MLSSLPVNVELSQVLNAAMLYWPMPNVLYVEGYALDRFAEDIWALQPVHQNRVYVFPACFYIFHLLPSYDEKIRNFTQVGLVLDAGIEDDLRLRHLQVVDAARASLGLSIVDYTVTDTPLKVWDAVCHTVSC